MREIQDELLNYSKYKMGGKKHSTVGSSTCSSNLIHVEITRDFSINDLVGET